MTMNPRTLMRMPLSKVLRIADYWGIHSYKFHMNDPTHYWKLNVVRAILRSKYTYEEFKSDFGQWRRV